MAGTRQPFRSEQFVNSSLSNPDFHALAQSAIAADFCKSPSDPRIDDKLRSQIHTAISAHESCSATELGL
jgi:hypothetical protein